MKCFYVWFNISAIHKPSLRQRKGNHTITHLYMILVGPEEKKKTFKGKKPPAVVILLKFAAVGSPVHLQKMSG